MSAKATLEFPDGQRVELPIPGLLPGEHEKAFFRILMEALRTYANQNPKYGSSWISDGLDCRTLFGELTAKYRRAKSLLWDQWDILIRDPAHRGRLLETVGDAILYLAMIHRRLDVEVGPVDPEVLEKLRDRS